MMSGRGLDYFLSPLWCAVQMEDRWIRQLRTIRSFVVANATLYLVVVRPIAFGPTDQR